MNQQLRFPMKIAVPEHCGRVSPVFDSSQKLVVFDIAGTGEMECRTVDLSGLHPTGRAALLRELEVDVLLCGGISAWLSENIRLSGVEVVPWLAGEMHQVLEAYFSGRISEPDYAMPGCCRRRRHRGGPRRRKGPNVFKGFSAPDPVPDR